MLAYTVVANWDTDKDSSVSTVISDSCAFPTIKSIDMCYEKGGFHFRTTCKWTAVRNVSAGAHWKMYRYVK